MKLERGGEKMPVNYKIRHAKLEDLKDITSLWNELSIDHLNKDPFFNKEIDLSNGEKHFVKAISNDKCCIFVAECDDRIVGFIEGWLYKKDFNFYIDDYAYILHKYIRPEYRGYKIAIDLYTKLEKWAINEGKKYLCSDVFEHNIKAMKAIMYTGSVKYKTRLVKKLV